MQWLKSALREGLGLVVEDGRFASAILLWLGVVWVLLPRLNIGRNWNGVFLFAGLAVILTESVWHRAGKSGR